MKVELKNARSKRARLILTCSAEEAQIVRNALMKYADTEQDEPNMSSTCQLAASMGYKIPDARAEQRAREEAAGSI